MSTLNYYFPDRIVEHLDFKLLYVNHIKHDGLVDYETISSDCTQLFYAIDGKGAFVIDGESYPVKAGDIVIINPHIKYQRVPDIKYKPEYIVFGIEGLSFQFGTCSHRNHGIFSVEKHKDKVMHLVNMLLHEVNTRERWYDIVCCDVVEILLLNVAGSQNLGLYSDKAQSLNKECCIVKSYIDLHYMENISLDSLAKLIHTNKYYLVHSFKKHLGDTPMNYLQQKRIQTAMELLTTTKQSVSTIATNVGFSSQSYFAQVFKKSYGVTPAQYRKSVEQQHHESQ